MGAVSDLQSRLQAQTITDGQTGWLSVRRAVVDSQDQIVVLTEAGGPEPGQRTGEEAQDVQVRVRGQPWDGDAAELKLREIRDDIQALQETTLGATAYREVYALGEPILVGFDDDGRPELTQTFRFFR